MFREYNFDGLVGPTHNYAGLATGNLASATHQGQVSRPRAAALQGLRKMRALHHLGVPQAILPPLERPSVRWLRHFGLEGPDEAAILHRAACEAPRLLSAACSASSMWTANAATVAPAPDTADERLHLTPANLSRHLHRAIEAPETTAILRQIFADEAHFWVHEPLAGGDPMRDEGAANHTRLTPDFAQPGLHLFVYGVAEELPEKPRPQKYTARQTLAASQAIARRHQLRPEQTLFIQQNPTAIDAGVFHHDVIGVGHRDILFCHEDAFAEPAAYAQIAAAYQQLTATELRVVTVPRDEVSVSTAVATYLFNSQIVTTQTGKTVLIAPGECGEDPAVKAYLERAVADAGHPLDAVEIFDLRESMHNGGGPACLRQRIVLSTAQAAALQGRVILDDALADELETWVTRHYREELRPADLADPQLLEECQTALDQLTQILALPSLYAFQS